MIKDKPTDEAYSIECCEWDCEGDAPFIKENKEGDCLHKCKKCGLKFWIRADGDIEHAE